MHAGTHRDDADAEDLLAAVGPGEHGEDQEEEEERGGPPVGVDVCMEGRGWGQIQITSVVVGTRQRGRALGQITCCVTAHVIRQQHEGRIYHSARMDWTKVGCLISATK